MILRPCFLVCLVLASAHVSIAHAAGTAEAKRCLRQEDEKGHGTQSSKVICAVRKMFQSRIRVKPDTEPVEMTVGSPPMISDDTDTPGPGNWEVNAVFGGDFSPDSQAWDLPLLDLNYGIGERLQLKYEVPYGYARMTQADATGTTTTTTASGIGNSLFGVKYRFYDNEESGLSLALYPQIGARTPGARLAADGGTAGAGTTLIFPLLLTWEFERFSVTGNLGLEHESAPSHSEAFVSFGAGTRLTSRLAAMAEIALVDFNLPDERRTRLNVGGRFKLSERHALVGSIGHDLQAAADLETQWGVSLAYQRFFVSEQH